jgi:hypothetical protein
MSTAIATVNPKAAAVAQRITGEERQKMRDLDLMLQGFREELADKEIGQLEKTLLQARAIAALEEAITGDMMRDMMKLMNSPLGFKTDKTPGKDKDGKDKALYHESTVKRCLIVAMLYGARVTGNEFNIIAGNCYLTKEFTRPAILRWPGLRRFEITIGAATIYGEETAAAEAVATWELNGELHELRCTKTPEMDARIIVNRYRTSSPDEIRGKVEAKLFQRVLGRLTGLNIETAMGQIGDRDTEAELIGEVSPVQDAAPVHDGTADLVDEAESAAGGMTDSETARMIFDQAKVDFAGCNSVNDVQAMCRDRIALVRSAKWADDLTDSTVDALAIEADERIAAIRSTRGK